MLIFNSGSKQFSFTKKKKKMIFNFTFNNYIIVPVGIHRMPGRGAMFNYSSQAHIIIYL